EEARATVLFCHGNGGNISHRLTTINMLHEMGLDVFLFDYRGYGRSEGAPSEAGTYLDAEAAWRYLTEQRALEAGRIVIHGRSLGGSIAAYLARDREPAALVVEQTPSSIPEIAADLYPFFPRALVRWLSRFDYNTLDYVKAVKCPVLVIHSRDDEMIPFSHGRRIFEAAGEPKEFIELRGRHNDAFAVSEEIYRKRLGQFISEHVGRPPR
ncbi:MAG: alpha/beta hydrolase, partial [Phycisphaerae bacterium]|nr:alpha/beta hydrolase [Phycisphaerae bacterium]